MDAKSEGGADDAVACLNASTGVVVWKSVFPAAGPAGVRSQSSTPCVRDGRLYVAGQKRVYCLDATTGKLIWQQAIDAPGDGVSCSLAVVDGIAIMISKGFYGFDALTGQVRWRRAEKSGNWNKDGAWGAYTSPVCWRHDGKNYVICSCKSVELMDPSTGQAVWKIPWVEGGWSSWNGNSSPAIVGDLMVINQKAGGLEGYSLSLESPTKLWHIPDHDVATSPLIYEGNVYTIGGGDYGKTTSIRCANLQQGTVAWEQALKPQGCSSPLAADGKIFGFAQFGKVLGMWKADPKSYVLLASAPVNADGYSSLAFVDGRLYLRMQDGISCYDLPHRSLPVSPEKRAELAALALASEEKAAARGDMVDEYRMGQRYRDGDGVTKDPVKSREWFAKAAAQGYKQAQTQLDLIDNAPVPGR
jgi:outer membrane protein assembly factor BamB